MQLLSWLGRQIGGELRSWPSHKHRPTPRCRPRLEALEDRCVPSFLPVTTTIDDADRGGTLRFAAAHARDGDTIVFTPALHGAPIVLTQGELILNRSVTIEPMFNAPPETISGGGTSRVFEVANGASVTLDSVIITGGMSADYYSYAGGGGIMVDPGAGLTLNGSTLSGNSTSSSFYASGGGIFNWGTLTANDSTVSGNSASLYGDGGGIANYGTLTVRECILSSNSTGDRGAGIFNRGTLTVSDCTLSGNAAQIGGGGAIYNDGTATISGSTLFGNSALGVYGAGYGGGILNAGTLTLSGSTVSGNSALYGGGGIANSFFGTLFVTNGSTITGNSVTWSYGVGGGIYNGGTLTLSASNVTGDSAPRYGGGIFNDNWSILHVLSASTVTGNTAPAGADLYNLGTYFISSDSTVGIIGP